MESRKTVPTNPSAGQPWRRGQVSTLVDTVREGECGTNGESSVETHTLPCMQHPANGGLQHDTGR